MSKHHIAAPSLPTHADAISAAETAAGKTSDTTASHLKLGKEFDFSQFSHEKGHLAGTDQLTIRALNQDPFRDGTVSKSGYKVVADHLDEVSKKMLADLSHLEAQIQNLGFASNQAKQVADGNWSTAIQFGANADTTTTNLAKFYEDLKTFYDELLTTLKKNASNYTVTEQANQGLSGGGLTRRTAV